MRKLYTIIFIVTVTLIMFFAILKKPAIDDTGSSTAVAGQALPWQVELHDGYSRVFGLTPGKSRIVDAVDRIGADYELAILAKPGQPEVLELYSGNFRTGGLTGSIIVVADTTVEDIQQLRSRLPVVQEHLETGTKKTTLRFEHQDAALAYVIKSITFIPVASITEDLLVQRFGPPVQVLKTAEKVTHYLYPLSGLSVIVNDSGRDFLQYVAPSGFGMVQRDISLQAGIYAQKKATEEQ